MAFLNPVDITSMVGVVTEEKLGSTLRAVRSRRYIWHVLLGLHRVASCRKLCLAAAYGMTRKIRGIGRRREVSRSWDDDARPPSSFRRHGVPMTRPFYPIGNKNGLGEFS